MTLPLIGAQVAMPVVLPSPRSVEDEMARRHLEDFTRAMMPSIDLHGAFHGSYYRLLEFFARGRISRLAVSLPPQHGKSLAASQLLPAFLLGLNPDLRIAVASYNALMASRFNRRVQRIVDSPRYRSIFPGTRIKSPGTRAGGHVRTASEFEVVGRRGSLISVGREGSLTGNPVDVFILDDLYKDALEASSPVVRENCREWYSSVVKTRLHNSSQELVVFTRWHEDDLIGHIASKAVMTPLTSWEQLDGAPPGAWFHLCLEALKESPPTPIDPRREGEALWPSRQSPELLAEKRRLDPHSFEALYQGRPSSKEGLLYGDALRTYDTPPERVVKRGNYTDTADAGGDYLCSVCYDVGADGVIYLTDVVYSGLGMEETEHAVASMFRRAGTRTALVESNNGGRGFARAVGRLAPAVHVGWFHQSSNKEARILSNAPAVLRRIAVPRDWNLRWSDFHRDVTTYRRLFRANRLHDAPDVLTGIVETESEGSAGRIRRVAFV